MLAVGMEKHFERYGTSHTARLRRIIVTAFSRTCSAWTGGTSLCVVQVISQLREKRKPMIIDADGLYITTKDPGLLKGYDLAILTPNKYAALRKGLTRKCTSCTI